MDLFPLFAYTIYRMSYVVCSMSYVVSGISYICLYIMQYHDLRDMIEEVIVVTNIFVISIEHKLG